MTDRAPLARLGILGDVHAEHERLATALDWFAGQCLDAVLCTGDLADGPGCINRCCALLRDAGVHTVAGNHDRWLLNDKVRHVAEAHRREELADDSRAFMESLPRTLELETRAGRLMLCHGVGHHDMAKVWPGTRGTASIRRSAALDGILHAGEHRFLVHGHLHYRVLIDFENLLLLNAGTLKGERAGLSVVDFDQRLLEAYTFADGRPQRSAEHTLDPGAARRVWRDTGEFDGRWQPVLF